MAKKLNKSATALEQKSAKQSVKDPIISIKARDGEEFFFDLIDGVWSFSCSDNAKIDKAASVFCECLCNNYFNKYFNSKKFYKDHPVK